VTPELLATAVADARLCTPREAAAVLVEIAGAPCYWPCQNLAAGNAHVNFAPVSLAAAEDAGRLLGYVHSHSGSTEPSGTDLSNCQATQLPWWIVNPAGRWRRLDPSSRPLLGRQYAFGVDDCWSIVRNWYAQNRALALPDFVREPHFWESGFEPHLAHMEAAGFVPVAFDSLREGDALLFRMAAKTITHCAVYLGGGWMLHHAEGHLSRRELLDRKWMKRLAAVVRHGSPS